MNSKGDNSLKDISRQDNTRWDNSSEINSSRDNLKNIKYRSGISRRDHYRQRRIWEKEP